MWCCVMSFDVTWFLVLCSVTWCNVMSCDAFSCDERHLLWSDTVQWDAISWVCDEMWLVAMSRCVVRKWLRRVVKWKMSWWSVLQSTPSTTKVLLRTPRYYTVLQHSTTKYHTVLLQYYSVLHSSTPVLQSTTPYYKVLLCTQSTTPVLLRTTKYYSSTTLYYKVLLQCYFTTLYCKVLLRYYKVLLRTTKYYSSTTLYYQVLLLTLRGATGVFHQRHQVLCVPGKMTRIIDPWHMKRHLQCAKQQVSCTNVTKYCACQEKWLASLILMTYQTSLQCAEQQDSPSNLTCHKKSLSWLILVTDETSLTMRGATGITLQPHQILRLPRKIALQNLREICRKQLKRHLECAADSSMIRTWSDHESKTEPRPFAELTFPPSATHFVLKITTFPAPAIYPNLTEYCACHEKWFSWLIIVTYYVKSHWQCAEQQVSFTNVTKYFACQEKWLASLIHDISNVINNAQSNRTHPPTSPNAASAT